MTSFSGIAFRELGNDGLYKLWSKAGIVVIKKIPGGGNVIQKIGVGLPRLSMPIQCTAAQLTSLYAVVGDSASLVFSYETTTARLESIDPPARVSINADLYETTLSFIRSGGGISTTPSTAFLTESGDTFVTEASDVFVTE